MVVLRGKKNHKDLGRLLAYNGDTGKIVVKNSCFCGILFKHFFSTFAIVLESNAWDADECNEFVGTDTTIVPPMIEPEKGEVLWGYDPSTCRSIGMSYANKKTKISGIPVYVYELDLSEDINKKACFCRDEDTCPPDGK